jgi:signal transduction histidine kinase
VKGVRATTHRRSIQYVARIVVIAGAYYGSAKLGLTFANQTRSISAVWAPSGIALAALVLWGYRAWPGVVLGAFLANSSTGTPLVTALGITVGNTLEALTGAYLLRAVRFRPSLERVRDVLALVLLAGVVSTTVGATMGVASLGFGDAIKTGEVLSAWRLWWLGDMGGDLLVAPLILVVARGLRIGTLRRSLPLRPAVDATILLAALVASGLFAFSHSAPIPYLLFPVLIAAALRLGQAGAVVASLIAAGIAVSFTAHGAGPFVSESPDASFLQAQTFVGTAAVTALLLGAVRAEQQRAQHKLERAREALEGKVRERTADLARSNQELAATSVRLLELDRMKDEFVATVSHDLRTPLASIVAYVEPLASGEEGELSDGQRHFLSVIGRNADRLGRLVDDLLFVAQIDSGGFLFERTEVDVAAVAAECVEAAAPQAEKSGVALGLDARDNVPPLLADRARLGQLLDNLVSNALKFTPEGGRVEVRVFSPEGRVVVEVADTGIGIPAGERRHLFERFYRASSSMERSVPGTGLGLAIAKAIADGHEGRIGIESEEGVGTTFRVELPIGRTEPAPRAARQRLDRTVAGAGEWRI